MKPNAQHNRTVRTPMGMEAGHGRTNGLDWTGYQPARFPDCALVHLPSGEVQAVTQDEIMPNGTRLLAVIQDSEVQATSYGHGRLDLVWMVMDSLSSQLALA